MWTAFKSSSRHHARYVIVAAKQTAMFASYFYLQIAFCICATTCLEFKIQILMGRLIQTRLASSVCVCVIQVSLEEDEKCSQVNACMPLAVGQQHYTRSQEESKKENKSRR